jgi:hypothetical protein
MKTMNKKKMMWKMSWQTVHNYSLCIKNYVNLHKYDFKRMYLKNMVLYEIHREKSDVMNIYVH